MPPKKEKKEAVPEVPLPPIPDHVVKLLTHSTQRWVQVHFKLLTSSFLDDVIRLPATANLFMVEAKIIAHHGGGISKLMFWKDDVQPKNILRDFSLTLKDVWKLDDDVPATIHHPNTSTLMGLGQPTATRFGAFSDVEDHQVVLCYDYKAHDSDCPLLLRSPRYTIQGFTGGATTVPRDVAGAPAPASGAAGNASSIANVSAAR